MDAVPDRAADTARNRPEVPHCVGFAAWAGAFLQGWTSLDEAHDAISGPDVLHLVTGVPGVEGAEPLILGLGRLRGLGSTGVRVSLPTPGDPVGLFGPPAFNRAALAHGGAVLLAGTEWGLLPVPHGEGVLWTAAVARTDGPLLDPGEADRALRACLSATATALAELEVARWNPDVADELLALRSPPPARWPHGMGQRTARVLELALRCLRITDLAGRDDGGARTAAEALRRRAVLEDLDRRARHAAVAVLAHPEW